VSAEPSAGTSADASADASGDPLAEIDGWGAGHAAAATRDVAGVVRSHGDTDHRFAIASVTKLATAFAVLVAIEEGAVTSADPAGPPGSTVHHLLCHASGLDFDSDRIMAAPGTRRIYSNTGYEALAAHLEQRAGMPFAEYLHEAVLAPLAMADSTLQGSPASGMVSTVTDLVRLAAEMQRPTLVDPSTWADATTAQFPELAGVLPGWGRQDPCPWGLGPELRGAKSPHWTGSTAAPSTYGHFGASGTFLWVDPVAGLACVTLTDRPFGAWAVDAWPGFSDRVRAAGGDDRAV